MVDQRRPFPWRFKVLLPLNKVGYDESLVLQKIGFVGTFSLSLKLKLPLARTFQLGRVYY